MNYSKSYIREILNEVKTVAVVGASAKKERDSFKVMPVSYTHLTLPTILLV